MLNRSCTEFVEILASKEAVPGGGGASAYVGSLGTALGSMVGNLTLGKKKYKDVEEDIKSLLDRSEKLIQRLNELVDEDAKAFKPLSEAYRLPSETEEEKEYKEKMIQTSLEAAAKAPLEIARVCGEAIDLHKEYAEKGSRLAVSDAGCGAVFCKAALQGARLNVLINLNLMKDEKLRDKMKKEIDEITSRGIKKADEIYEYVESVL
ncbi:MAG: cyclodeaminase/cyclohydrolase family protein [Bacillota bacterium]|nr:cyclodeaminase/cyclohydrolase family protein [Bacillota bacterium]